MPVDEFHRHELMDRAHFVVEILSLLEEHPAHTPETRKAYGIAMDRLYQLYQAASNAAMREGVDP